jgi:lysophospholipase L1-like esterase
MVLGDSLTWGVGLDESERYSNLLEKYLKEMYPHTRIEVLNFGLGGGPTIVEAKVLYKYYKILKPNLVIVGFCVNDPQPRSQDYSPERETYFKKIEPLLQFLSMYNLKGSVSLLSRVYENLLIKLKKIPFWTEALDRSYVPDTQEWKTFTQSLHYISAISREVTPYPPIFISLNQGLNVKEPTDYNAPDEYLDLFLKWYHQAEATATQSGFLVINCEQEFKEQLNDHIMAVIVGRDGHPTPLMNKVYAEKLAKTIQDNKFVETFEENADVLSGPSD